MKRIDKLALNFVPAEKEAEIYQKWLDHKAFEADNQSSKEAFTIVMPPPNITGKLHMGHGYDLPLQDIIIRFKRMQGYEALWLPGSDHASIATESRVVAMLKEEGISKEDLGREGFLAKTWEWKEKYGKLIMEQIKRLGASCDWSRERFTLDEGLSKAVKYVFTKLYEEGLIYRGERLIHWCPSCLTSISDLEVDHIEVSDAALYYLKYELVDGSDFLSLATTRPETLLGDTAVAVNPEDERYLKFIGQEVYVPLIQRKIKVIADSYVDPEFGTGVVKITPAHDPNDFEVGQRHGLELINILDEKAVLNENADKYAGLTVVEARKKVLHDLKEAGLLIKQKKHLQQRGQCSRCDTVIEPRLSLQWFVQMDELAKRSLTAVRDQELEFIPERFVKTFYHWMENTRDWCISRQLWWGHQIPVWYCQDCSGLTVSSKAIKQCQHCASVQIVQDEDTLDTWFSSALWPFSTLGWPEETLDFKKFYPGNCLVTGSDIISFWVSRMIFSALHFTDQVPFTKVLVHGLVRDDQGRKMSKSLDNGIDPLEVIDKYGADALRFAYLKGVSIGNDLRHREEKFESARNFVNKVWQAARFILMNLDEEFEVKEYTDLELEDRWILAELNHLVAEVSKHLEQYDLSLALEKTYDFTWNLFCDWYIEVVKPRLNSSDEDSRNKALFVLNKLICTVLALLHPYMPFFTEDLYAHFIHEDELLIRAKWPLSSAKYEDEAARQEMGLIIDLISQIRNRRAELEIKPSLKIRALLKLQNQQQAASLEKARPYIIKLARLAELEIIEEEITSKVVIVPCLAGSIYLPLADLYDLEEEQARLKKEEEKIRTEVKILEQKLANQGFVKKAPPALVESVRAKLKLAEQSLAKCLQNQEELAKL